MNTSRIALYAAVTSVLAFAAKALSIGLSNGQEVLLTEVFFLVGFVAQLIALTSLVLAFTRGHPRWMRAAAVVAAPLGVVALVAVIQAVVQRVQPEDPSWAWAEVNLWVTSAVVLVLAVRGYLSTSPTTKNVEPRMATMSDTSVPGSSSVST